MRTRAQRAPLRRRHTRATAANGRPACAARALQAAGASWWQAKGGAKGAGAKNRPFARGARCACIAARARRALVGTMLDNTEDHHLSDDHSFNVRATRARLIWGGARRSAAATVCACAAARRSRALTPRRAHLCTRARRC
jgi:hypothetical protein